MYIIKIEYFEVMLWMCVFFKNSERKIYTNAFHTM